MEKGYKYIIINSYDRPNQSEPDTDFNLSITGGTSFNNISKVGVVRFVVTNSVYNVSSSQNYITFQENIGPAVNAILSPGNYSLNQIISSLQTAMNLVSPNSRTYTITANALTSKLAFTSSAGSFTIKADQGNGLNLYLGLSRRTDNLSVGSVLNCPRIYNLNKYNTFLLKSNICRPETYNTIENSQSGILESIPISQSVSGDIYTYEPTIINWREASYNSIERISIQLTDDKGEIIDLNGGFCRVYLAVI